MCTFSSAKKADTSLLHYKNDEKAVCNITSTKYKKNI